MTEALTIHGAGTVYGGTNLVDQFGGPLRVPTDDPAFQPPANPLKDVDALSRRAKVINREIPNVVVEQGWSPMRVRQALSDLVVGLFDLPSQLQDAISSDSRVQSAMRSGSNGLLGQAITFQPPKRFAKDETAKKACRKWENHWQNMNAEPAMLDLLERDSLGFSYSQILWDTGGKTWLPYLQSWNARYSYYHWILRAHIAITLDGQTPITPGDGHWVLHAPYSQYRGWMRGALRPVAQWWLARNYALRDWARYSERHGFPILLAYTPFGADPNDIANYQAQLSQLGQESVLQLPGSVDQNKYGKYDLGLAEPKDSSWQAFKELIEQCNAEITLSLLGQNLTSEIKEGSMAAARVHANVLQTWLAADARSMQRTLYTQILRPFAALNFGNADLAPVPKWNVTPPEDQETHAKTLASFGQGINQMRLGGIRVKDPVRFARTFGLKLGEIEHVDPTQVESKLASATGEATDAPEPNSEGDHS